MKRKGLTLIEILVSMSIVLFMLSALYLCFTQGMRVYRSSSETIPAFREGSLAMQRICKDFQIGTYQIVYPDVIDLCKNESSLVICARYNFVKKEKEIIGYSFDTNSESIKRVIYSLDAFERSKLEVASLPGNPRIIAKAKSLKFKLENTGLLNVSICLKNFSPSLRTKINCDFIPQEVLSLQ